MLKFQSAICWLFDREDVSVETTTRRDRIAKSTPSSSRNATPEPLKLRSSCDRCSLAKVKCSKEKPQCQRCGNLAISCNYSRAMRMGKPPTSRRNTDSTKADTTGAERRSKISTPTINSESTDSIMMGWQDTMDLGSIGSGYFTESIHSPTFFFAENHSHHRLNFSWMPH